MAKIRELKNNANEIIYPVSTTEAVYMPNGIQSLDNALSGVMDQTATITFDGSGNIVKDLANGNKVTTKFMLDGSIEEETVNKDGTKLTKKRVEFSENQIKITVE